MARQIKFRAWNTRSKQMEQVERFFINEKTIEVGYGFTGVDKGIWQLSNCELMQFTGLQDLNGVDIYDKHILKHPASGQIGWIKWLDSYCGFRIFYSQYDHSDIGMQIGENGGAVVIGNLIQNPELLGESNESSN